MNKQLGIDVAVAAAVLAVTPVVAAVVDRAGGFPSLALNIVLCGLLVFRRRRPWPVLVCSTAGGVLSMALTGVAAASVVPAIVAAYTVGSLTAGVAAVVLAGSAVLLCAPPGLDPVDISVFAWTAMAAVTGYAVRTRRAYVNELKERAMRAEREREAEARRRVVEERLTIARELHDVLAHHIALINIQSGVAAHLLRDKPELAGAALARIREAGRTILGELGVLLDVLRESGDLSTEPMPSMARIDDLVESYRAAGLPVRSVVSGRRPPLPAATDLALYRVVQEALTNAHKHAPGTTTVTVEYGQTMTAVEVRNDLPAEAGSVGHSAGLGLVGMRERMTAVNGRLTVGPDSSGRFCVRAEVDGPFG